jgi:AcrR family transcriptional regulator
MRSSTPQTARRASETPARRGRPSRRPEIFAAALRLFRERGFHATSLNDIGADAGVAGTAIYSHFATKQELLAEAIREGARRIREGVTEALADRAQDPEAALENLVRTYVGVVLDNADMYACYVLEARSLPSAVRQPLVRSERGLRDVWLRQLMAVRPELSREQAMTMVQMAIFALVALCVHRHQSARDELVEQATSFVLGALYSPVPNNTP